MAVDRGISGYSAIEAMSVIGVTIRVMPRWHTMPRREERQSVDGKDNELNAVLV
jgi:hypothetical protein